MDFSFSITNNPISAAPLALRTVYRVFADRTYDVRKNPRAGRDLVALQTTGGRGIVTIEGRDDISVLPGTLLFFEHCRVRRYYCADISWDFWWFEFSTDELLDIPLNRLHGMETAEEERGDCLACLELLGKPGADQARLASAAFSLLLCKWLMKIGRGRQGHPHREAVEEAIDEMKRHPDRRLRVADLARGAGLCERRFRQVFADMAGMQPKKYRDALRVRMAEELLLNTPFPVGEIAQRLGYSSPYHFCKAFRNARGVPPTLFRASGQFTKPGHP